MSTNNQQGYAVEAQMRKMLRAKECLYDEIDFTTKRYAYECKSARIFNLNKNNGNQKRSFKRNPHKPISSLQLGRFMIKRENHVKLKLTAQELNLTPRYLFVLHLGKQTIKKVISWEEVNILMKPDKNTTCLRIRDIWPEVWR
jgi:hypothetical protein